MPSDLIDLIHNAGQSRHDSRYMQTKAQAAGERTRWATDTENVGRTFV